MRELEKSKNARATAAIDYFVYAITKFAGAYAAVLGGLDALVFTAGIGESAARARGALQEPGVAWRHTERVVECCWRPADSAPASAVPVWVTPTNEELMIAQHTLALATP
jgi:acetate kinase